MCLYHRQHAPGHSRQLRQFCLRLPVLFGWHGASFKGVGAARIPTGRPVIRRSLALSVPFQSGRAHAAASGLGPHDTRENSGESLPIHSIWASGMRGESLRGPNRFPATSVLKCYSSCYSLIPSIGGIFVSVDVAWRRGLIAKYRGK